MVLCKQETGEMLKMEQADEFAQEPQMAQYVVQVTTRFLCPLECMPGLLIATINLKSFRKNRDRLYESSGSRAVLPKNLDKLWGAGGETPPAYSIVRCNFAI